MSIGILSERYCDMFIFCFCMFAGLTAVYVDCLAPCSIQVYNKSEKEWSCV